MIEVQKRMTDIYAGKRVCLVGPADNFIDSKEISKAEILVFPNFYLKYRPFLGDDRFKIFYVSGADRYIAFNAFWSNKDKERVILFKNIKLDSSRIVTGYEFPHFPTDKESFADPSWEFVNELFALIGSSPFTGFIALKHILMFSPLSIHITGWDLFGSKKDKQKVINNVTYIANHSLDGHARYLRRLLKYSRRITIDDGLKKELKVYENKKLIA